MNLKTTILLLVVLGLLASAIYWQKGTEQSERDVDVRLFGDVDLSLVDTIRIDNIERSYHLRLERDSQGVWFITDPINYPAETGIVRLLLEDVAKARGLVVPENEQGEKELGFAPPRVVIEVDERRPDGVHTKRVEIGAPDMDRIRLNVRVNGRYLRSLVRIYTTVNRILDEFRSKRALTVAGEDVIEVHRTGRVIYDVEEEPHDLELHAFRDGFAWRATGPKRALLASLDVGVLVFGTSRLMIQSFVEDEVEDLAPYGLDHPLVRIDLKTGSGATEVLLMSQISVGGTWFVKRQDAPYVWSLESESALRLLYPSEEMYDRHFMRALRADVTSIRLVAGPDQELRLDRGPEGWVVREKLASGEYGAPLPADERRIEDELARLESLELEALPEDIAHPTPAELDALPRFKGGIFLEVGGESLGGQLGRVEKGELEQAGLLFRRTGDELLLVAEDWLEELVRTSADEFRSKSLVRLIENRITRLTVSSAESSRSYTRDKRGLWHPEGEDREATELLAWLDPLIYLKAEKFLPADAPLGDSLELVFERFEEDEVRLRIAPGEPLDGAPTSVAEVGGVRSRLKVAGLYEGLAKLLAR